MALLNWRIVVSLRRTTRQARMFRMPTDGHKANARQSARIMVTMVMVYLLSNGLNIIITIYERLSVASLLNIAPLLPSSVYCRERARHLLVLDLQ